jgi:hypothetical protein
VSYACLGCTPSAGGSSTTQQLNQAGSVPSCTRWPHRVRSGAPGHSCYTAVLDGVHSLWVGTVCERLLAGGMASAAAPATQRSANRFCRFVTALTPSPRGLSVPPSDSSTAAQRLLLSCGGVVQLHLTPSHTYTCVHSNSSNRRPCQPIQQMCCWSNNSNTACRLNVLLWSPL